MDGPQYAGADGEDVHQALLPARERMRGVFYGHVHQTMQTVRDGILYVAVASTFAQFSSWPTDETVGYVGEETPAYNFVRVCAGPVDDPAA